jgi:hypothetical protein
VVPHFVERLTDALCDDAEQVRARLRRQFVQLADVCEPFLKCLLRSLDVLDKALVECTGLRPIANDLRRVLDSLPCYLGLTRAPWPGRRLLPA